MLFTATFATANPAGSITYPLKVKNKGQDPAYSVDVQEDFPAFPVLNPVSFTASQGVYNPATGHWDLASLPVGDTATLTFTVMAPNCACSLVDNASTSSPRALVTHHKPPVPTSAANPPTAPVTSLSPPTASATSTAAGTS